MVGPLALLALALAVGLGIQLTDSPLDPWPRGGTPTPAPSPAATAAPLADGFATAVRQDLPSLDISMGNAQLEQAAQGVCDALTVTPMAQVYAEHDVPATSPEDASRFIGMAVAWKCPTHAAALAELTR